MTNPLHRVLVLGLGNDILTDDAVGLRIVEMARPVLAATPGVDLTATTEMGLALLDLIVGYESVVIVDSVQTGRKPAGFVHDLAVDEIPQIGRTSPHFLGVRETLALGEMLGLSMPRALRIVAVEVEDPFTLGTELTRAVGEVVPIAVARVVGHVRAFLRADADNSTAGPSP